jgi:hypothetical protein
MATDATTVPAVPGPAPEPVVQKKTKKPRKNPLDSNLSSARVGMCMSSARTKWHMGVSLTPRRVRDSIKTLNDKIKDAKKAATAESQVEVNALKDQVAELNKQSVRIGGAAPIALTAVAESVMDDLIKTAFATASANKHHTAEVEYLHTTDTVTHLPTYAVWCNLPSYLNYSDAFEKQEEVRNTEANKLRKKDNATRKEAHVAAVAAAKAAGEPLPVLEKVSRTKKSETTESVESAESTESERIAQFDTYINNKIVSIKEANPDYNKMRVSTRFRCVLRDLSAELMKRISELSRLLILESANSRTMTVQTVKTVVRMLYINRYGDEHNQNLNDLINLISDKVAAHRAIESSNKVVKTAKKQEELAAKPEADRVELAAKAAAKAEQHRLQQLAAAQLRLAKAKESLEKLGAVPAQ